MMEEEEKAEVECQYDLKEKGSKFSAVFMGLSLFQCAPHIGLGLMYIDGRDVGHIL